MDKVRIGIIGVGGMGSHHANYLKNGEVNRAELTAVCDIDESKLSRFADLPKFTDSRELIRSGLVDAVLVATPHYGHTTIGIDALENGLHLLVEKPISVHKADCERLIAAHKNKKQIFGAMFQQRTDNRFKKLKQVLSRGELGQITRINWIVTDWFRTQAYYDSGGWRATWAGEGGGVLMNQCPHNLDMWQYLFGMPIKVQGFCGLGARHNIETEDQVTAYMEYANGATGVFITTTGEAPGTNRLEIAGERGKIVLDGGKIHFRRNEESMIEFSKTCPHGFASPGVWDIEIPFGNEPGGHNVVTQSFVNAILDGTPLVAEAEDGINSVELANAMIYSSFLGKPIDLPLDAAAYEAMLKEKIANSKFVKTTIQKQDEDMNSSFK